MIRMVFNAGRASVVSAAFIVFASPASAQSILLQIRPHVGDTLRVRLHQEVAMTSFPVGCGNSASAFQSRPKTRSANCAAIRTDTIRAEIFSRAVVRRATRDATEILAITDSVRSSSGSGKENLQKSSMKGPVEMRISTDGSVELGAGPASDDVRTLFGQMPATLSRKSVAVGEKWNHEMRMPLIDEPGATGRVRTTLQLDSLSRGGNIAYISMRGVLSHDHSDGSPSEMSGSLLGSMRLDRRLAWITDTHATIDVWTVVKNASSGRTMDVHTHVLQSLSVTGSR
jgi:hypothetical protein